MCENDASDDPIFTKQGMRIRVACKGSQRLTILKYWTMADYDHGTETATVELYAQNSK